MVSDFKMDISFIFCFRFAGKTDLFVFLDATIDFHQPDAQMGIDCCIIVIMLDNDRFSKFL